MCVRAVSIIGKWKINQTPYLPCALAWGTSSHVRQRLRQNASFSTAFQIGRNNQQNGMCQPTSDTIMLWNILTRYFLMPKTILYEHFSQIVNQLHHRQNEYGWLPWLNWQVKLHPHRSAMNCSYITHSAQQVHYIYLILPTATELSPIHLDIHFKVVALPTHHVWVYHSYHTCGSRFMSYSEIEQSRTARIATSNRSETHLPRSFTGSLLRRLRDDFVSAPRNHLGAQQYLINQLESLAI
jgi:hypothetical protein